jgi:hypothetical protein
MMDNILTIFEVFLKLVKSKGYISEGYVYREIYDKFNEYIKYNIKSGEDILKSSKVRRLRQLITLFNENLDEVQFQNIINDLLPILFYILPDKDVFEELADEFAIDLNYVIVLDDFGNRISYELFEYYKKNNYVSFENPSFVDIVSILFQHVNLTDTFFSHFYKIGTDAEIDTELQCFYYPEQFWYKFDDYLVNLKDQYGKEFRQVMKYQFLHMAPIIYAIKMIVTSPELYQYIKQECALVLCDNLNLFEDFSQVIDCIMTFLRKSKFLFPLRYRLMDFLLELKYFSRVAGQEENARNLQIQFLKKLFFLNKCHCCDLYHSMDDTIIHVAYENIEDDFEILKMSKQYFVFHFLSCKNCYESQIDCDKCQSCDAGYGFHSMPYDLDEYENMLRNQFYTFGYENESNINIFLTNDNPTRRASEVHEERLETVKNHVTSNFKEYAKELTGPNGYFYKSIERKDIDKSIISSFLRPSLITFAKKSTDFFLSYIVLGCSEDTYETYNIDNTFVCPQISQNNINFVSSMANSQRNKELNKKITNLQNKLSKVIRIKLKMNRQGKRTPSYIASKDRIETLENSIQQNIQKLEKLKPGIVQKIFGFYRPFFDSGKKAKYVYQGFTY